MCYATSCDLFFNSFRKVLSSEIISSSDSEGEEEEAVEYAVEKICKKVSDVDDKVWYLIKWKGWAEPTWEPRENCNLTEEFEKELLDNYEEQQKM